MEQPLSPLIERLEQLEFRMLSIDQRNLRVASDKAWEVSFTRRAIVAGITYGSVVLVLCSIGVSMPLLHALVPTAGYLLSTLTLPWAKRRWIESRMNDQ
jgi:hypothetical protein